MASRFDVRRQWGFTTIAMICFFLLYLPIVTLVLFAFNAGQSLAVWEGLSLQWFVSAWNNTQVQEAAIRSLVIAVFAATIATIAATMAALATTRTEPYPGLTFKYAFINQPLMVPEIVTAVALLIFFGIIKVATGYQGLGYLIAAHSAFCIPFEVLDRLEQHCLNESLFFQREFTATLGGYSANDDLSCLLGRFARHQLVESIPVVWKMNSIVGQRHRKSAFFETIGPIGNPLGLKCLGFLALLSTAMDKNEITHDSPPV